MLFIDLIQNVALLLALSVGYDILSRYLPEDATLSRVFSGVLFGGIAVIGMMTPMTFAPGLVYDGRSIVLTAAGYIAGPIAAVIAAGIAGAYRIFLGGIGTIPGILVIIESTILGTAAWYLRRVDSRMERPLYIWTLGIAVHALMLLSQLILPGGLGWVVIRRIGVVVIILYSAALQVVLTVFFDRQRQKALMEELKVKEAEYRALFENRHAPMLVIDFETGQIVNANAAAEAFYGWTVAELRSMYIFHINTLGTDRIRRDMERVRENRQNRFEFRHRRKDGSVREVAVFSGTVSIQGKLRIYSIIEDITDRKRAEEEIRKSAEEREVLLREIHHRVRNNLAAVSGLINLQVHGLSGEITSLTPLEQTRDRIMVMGMIHDMLYQTHDYTAVDFSAFLRQLASHVLADPRNDNIDISVDGDQLHLDMTQAVPLGIAVNEAVTNVVTHAFPGRNEDNRGLLNIDLRSRGDTFSVTLEDNGVGIPAELERENALGFQLMESLVEQIGGSLSVTTAPHGGCVVMITGMLRSRPADRF